MTGLTLGPLADLPSPDRWQVARAIRAGRPLAKSTHLPLAAGYARRLLKLYAVAMTIGVMVVGSDLARLIADPAPSELFGVVFLIFIPIWGRESLHARRFHDLLS